MAGRSYATATNTHPGDWIVPDEWFDCMFAGDARIVEVDTGGLYVPCDEGKHYLDGQLNDTEEYVGLYHCRPPRYAERRTQVTANTLRLCDELDAHDGLTKAEHDALAREGQKP